jgi:hypothetical protein
MREILNCGKNHDSRVVVYGFWHRVVWVGCCQRFAATCSHLRMRAKYHVHLALFQLIVSKILGKE